MNNIPEQLRMLRRQCIWQRAKGTSRDNGYPYHKHVPDCEICRAADTIELLKREIETLIITAKNRKDD